MPRMMRQSWAPYLVAVATIAAAALLGELVVQSSFESGLLFALFFAAVTCASWYGGLWPGVTATVLSYFIANWLFVRPVDRFTLNGTMLAYFIVCIAIAAFSEITRRARRRAEANAQQISSILEGMPDGFVAINDQWQVTYTNPAARQYFQLPPLETQRPVALEDFLPLARGPALGRLQEAAAAGVTVEFEQFYEPTGRWLEVNAAPGTAGGLGIYFRDVTERELAQEEQRKLVSIVDSSNDAIIGVDLAEKISSWNPGAKSLYGYNVDEVLGQPISILSPPDQEGDELALLSKIARAEQVLHFDSVHLAKCSRRIHVSLSISPIRDAGGRIVGVSMISRDITDRKRAEDMQREAERRKDNFLAVLGHELRNPLAAIVNAAEVLNYVASLPPDAVEIRDLIKRQALQMKRLIDDLLDVSRIASGKIVLRKERLELSRLIGQIVQDYRPRLQDKKLSLDLQLPNEALWIDGDAMRLSQVLGNLLENAVKFSDLGGPIAVTLAAAADHRSALIAVRDDGAGLMPEASATLFEPFAQAEETLDRSPTGLGLGLALVKGLAEMHGGAVTADSPGPGEGSTFTIWLPLVKAPATRVPPPMSKPRARASCRGLIIEDNLDVSRPIARLLELNGHQVRAAVDGPSGVRLARQFVPDIVLCDIGLPGDMDGYAVARELRSDPSTRTAYLVAVTGFGQEADRRRAADAGFDRHLTKPVDHSNLLELISEIASARAHAAAGR
ncbi:MAG: PAS domain-containing protein [Pirellulales bacterium]